MGWEPGHRAAALPPTPMQSLAVFVKDARSVRLIERNHPLGRELVCLMAGDVLWSRTFKVGNDAAFEADVEAARAAFKRRGWTVAE